MSGLWIDDGDVRLYHGDALEQLAAMPDESVQCIVTSPPFWALRDYGTATWTPSSDTPEVVALTAACDHLGKPIRTRENLNRNAGTGRDVKNAETRAPMLAVCTKCGAIRVDNQIGLEATPDEWCQRLVAVFRECRRVLRHDGVMWLEVGDTYNSGTTAKRPTSLTSEHGGWENDRGAERAADPGSKPKDLVGAPWMLAFALRADGWYLRSDTIWARPNPMPESVTDRPTKAHSYVFLLTKQSRYFYDADAIREAYAPQSISRAGRARNTGYEAPGQTSNRDEQTDPNPIGANARSVWSIPTEPTPFAHFATFPQTLVERCIKAGTSERGGCTICGAPWTRQTERTLENPGNRSNNGKIERSSEMRAYDARREVSVETTGWVPSCECNGEFLTRPTTGVRGAPATETYYAPRIPLDEHPVRPCVVLDPFMGSGTTALVARRLGRHAIGVELNEEYLAIAWQRLDQLSLFAQ